MKTPWHIWVVSILSLLWNLGGVYDYLGTHMWPESYLAEVSPEIRNYFTSFPAWAEVFWAMGVWGAVIGSVLLLLRSRLADFAFALSLIGMFGNLIYGFVIAPTPMTEFVGPAQMGFAAAIVIVAILLWIYARKMTARGYLR